MKRKLKTVGTIRNGSPEYWKNECRFRLLATLPSFQRDIADLRKELRIPEGGLTDDDFQVWYEKDIISKSDIITSSKKFNEKLQVIHTLQIKNYGEYLKQLWIINDTAPLNRLRNRIEILGKKYKLPANFYESQPLGGLFAYVTRNIIVPPSNNWAIQVDPEKSKNNRAGWIAIKTYALLSNKEFDDARKMLKNRQDYHFYEGVATNQRVRTQFERDLEIYNELTVQRKKKPTRKKIYSGYLSRLKNPVERKRWERLHSSGVTVGFDETTSNDVAKRFKMTSDAVRKALGRIKATQIELFGEENVGR